MAGQGDSDPPHKDSIYSRHWDQYVEADWKKLKDKPEWARWPGDEWGHPNAWEWIYQKLFVTHGAVKDWRKAVEIGQGSGKYTLKVLRNPEVEIRAYDVSAKFLDVCAIRCQEYVEAGRLSLRPLDVSTPSFMLSDLDDWKRSVDALYSIGAMVHVDLQYLMAYLVTASAVLRPGGKLILTLGTTATDAGFRKLLRDIKLSWGGQAAPRGSAKFEWVSGCMIESLLPRLGFEIDFLYEPSKFIALMCVASLTRPEVGDELVGHVSSETLSK